MGRTKSFADKIKITGYDELFGGSSGGKCDAQIMEVSLRELYPFENHPFKVKDDEEMEKLVESVKENGVLVPAMARPRKGGGYELISGHRRRRAAELAGLSSMPVIVREIDDDEAVISMVDANLQREVILPSEKAFSYKMKLEALKHQGKRMDLTSGQNDQKLNARKRMAEDSGESESKVRRYIRLTELIPDLLNMVDENRVGFQPGVEMSFLNKTEQKTLLFVMKEMQVKPTVKQAIRLKALSKDGRCSRDAIYAVLKEEPCKPRKVVIRSDKLADYFPENVSEEVIERTIFDLLDEWKKTQKKGKAYEI